ASRWRAGDAFGEMYMSAPRFAVIRRRHVRAEAIASRPAICRAVASHGKGLHNDGRQHIPRIQQRQYHDMMPYSKHATVTVGKVRLVRAAAAVPLQRARGPPFALAPPSIP